jgi:hypothetical protein
MTNTEMIKLLGVPNTNELQTLIWYIETVARRDYFSYMAELCDTQKKPHITFEDLKNLSLRNQKSCQKSLDYMIAMEMVGRTHDSKKS